VAHRSTFYLDISYEGGSARVASIDLVIGNANILLVDDDCGCPYESHSTAMMSKIDKYPDCWCVAEKGCPREVFQQYQSVIWFTGDDRETALSSEEQTAIAFNQALQQGIEIRPITAPDDLHEPCSSDLSHGQTHVHRERMVVRVRGP
jgi:hypothetical protein